MTSVQEASQTGQVRRRWPPFQELRPHLDEAEFLRRWERQRAQGYRIVYIELDGQVVAAAGFRFMATMAWGHILYLDDLTTLKDYRGRGFGTQLLAWLEGEARARGCDAFHLDSGYQRHAAHRVYLDTGFQLSSHHFAKKIEAAGG